MEAVHHQAVGDQSARPRYIGTDEFAYHGDAGLRGNDTTWFYHQVDFRGFHNRRGCGTGCYEKDGKNIVHSTLEQVFSQYREDRQSNSE